jgi:hypothetical protein
LEWAGLAGQKVKKNPKPVALMGDAKNDRRNLSTAILSHLSHLKRNFN